MKKTLCIFLSLLMAVSMTAVFALSASATGAGYYVVGDFTGWAPAEGFQMTRTENPDSDEWVLRCVPLTTESQFKIAYTADGVNVKSTDWYPEGMGNNYGENGEIVCDGEYDIYFRPNMDGGDDWYYGYVYLTPGTIPAEDVFLYRTEDGEAEIIGFDPNNVSSGALELPSSLGGCPVTSIASSAFFGFAEITSVTVPDTVRAIGSNAFAGCAALAEISFPDTVSSIGMGVIANTAYYDNEENWTDGVLFVGSHLIEARYTVPGAYGIPDGTKTIAESAFYSCYALTEITVPESVTVIPKYAFNDCTGLKTITLPAGLTAIEESAFSSCNMLEEITLPAGLAAIGALAFNGCTALREIAIPASAAQIGTGVFGSCNALESITVDPANGCYHAAGNCLIETAAEKVIAGCKNSVIPADGSVTVIGTNAFFSIDTLREITVPAAVGTVEASAFYYCENIESLTIENGVRSIGEKAFAYCFETKDLAIPASVTEIGERAFFDWRALENITVDPENTNYLSAGSCLIRTADQTLILGCKNSVIPADGSVTAIGDWAFARCCDLTAVTIPEGIAAIGYGAFMDCAALTSAVLPQSVTEIGEYAFSWCEHLAAIGLGSGVGVIAQFAFYGCAALTDVYYAGTEEDRAAIVIGDLNDPLLNAAWNYSSSLCLHPHMRVYYVKGTEYEPPYWVTRCADCGAVLNATAAILERSFTDLNDPAAWYYDYCFYCGLIGVFSGNDKGEFEPAKNISRAELATVIANYLYPGYDALPEDEFEALIASVNADPVQLTDIAGKWYERPARLVAAAGIVSGNDQRQFMGENSVTREQMAVMLCGAFRNAGLTFAAPVEFADADQVSGWAAEEVAWCGACGLFEGDANHNFNPKASATRAEVAVLFAKIDTAAREIVWPE